MRISEALSWGTRGIISEDVISLITPTIAGLGNIAACPDTCDGSNLCQGYLRPERGQDTFSGRAQPLLQQAATTGDGITANR